MKRRRQGRGTRLYIDTLFAPRGYARGRWDAELIGQRPGTAQLQGAAERRSAAGPVIDHAVRRQFGCVRGGERSVRFDFPLPWTARLP